MLLAKIFGKLFNSDIVRQNIRKSCFRILFARIFGKLFSDIVRQNIRKVVYFTVT